MVKKKVLWILVGCILFSIQFNLVLGVDISEGLNASWSFDDNLLSATDYSLGLVSGTVEYIPGIKGKGANFTSGVEVANRTTGIKKIVKGNYTICGAVKWNSTVFDSSINRERVITVSGGTVWFGRTLNTGYNCSYQHTQIGDAEVFTIGHLADYPISTNAWMGYCMVYNNDSKTMKLYVNATEVYSQSGVDNGYQLSVDEIYFGSSNSLQSSQASIDEFSIWSDAKTLSEIRAWWNDGSVCSYPFTNCAVKPPTLSNNITNNTYPQINDDIQFNVSWYDVDGLATSIFSWNCTSDYTWQNISLVNITGVNNVSMFNITLNFTRNITSCAWMSFANDTSGNTNQTEQLTIVIKKKVPNATVVIINKPLTVSENLSITKSFSDGDNDTWVYNETRWYLNGTYQSDWDNFTFLSYTNTTNYDNWTVSFRVKDLYNWSDWINDSVVIFDTTAPTLRDLTLSATSGYLYSVVTITANCSDTLSTISSGFPKVQITDPNSVVTNFTMSLDSGDIYTKSYATGGAVGTYTFDFYCKDDSNNMKSNTSTGLTYTTSERPFDGGGGGGGGGSSIPRTPISQLEGTPIIDFGTTQSGWSFVTVPQYNRTKTLKLTNLGDVEFNGNIKITPDLDEYINVKVCEIGLAECSSDEVKVLTGESMLLVIDGNFDENLGFGVIGTISLENEQQVFPLEFIVDRPPGYTLYKGLQNSWFGKFFNLTELGAVIWFVIIAIAGLILAYYTLLTLGVFA